MTALQPEPPRASVGGEIVVAIDGSPPAEAALALAAELARRDGVRLHVTGVLEESVGPVARLVAAVVPNYLERWRADRLYERLRAQANRVLGDDRTQLDVTFGDPATEITGLADSEHAGLTILGLGAHAPYEYLLGAGTALHVVRRSNGPVLAVAAGRGDLPRRAVVGIDFSPASLAAARAALHVVAADATLSLCHGEGAPDVNPAARAADARTGGRGRAERLDELRSQLVVPAGVRVETHVLPGDPAAALLRFAAEHAADLVATGARRLGPRARFAAGSVSGRVLRGATCSVLVAPAP